jgi:basic membrane protein A
LRPRARPRFARTASGFLALALFCVLSVLPGCGGVEPIVWKLGKPFAKENIKIGILYPNEITKNSRYDYEHYLGTLEMQANLELSDSQIIRKVNVFDDEPGIIEAAMRDCIEEGANIILAASWGYMNVCEKLAEEFPHVIFAHATGYKSNRNNFTNYSARMYQARYLAGIAAGLKTETGKIGYVAAMGKENSEVTGGINAFAIGVEKVNPRARVYVKFTYSWFDPMGETEAAAFLAASGCDVITQHCNTPAPQLAAEKAGVWGIGFNSDMSGDAPGAVITSVVPRWGVVYTRFVRSVIDGSFRPVPHFWGLKEGAVDLTPLNEKLAATGTFLKLAEERARIMYRGFNVFDGTLYTNDGKTVGKEGSTLSDELILGGMNWYYRNVTEL